MSFVAINVLTVPPQMRAVLEERFGNRAGEVDKMDGFQAFELLRPAVPEDGAQVADGTFNWQDSYLVYTRWDRRESFEAWLASAAFGQGHAQASAGGPAATGSQVWTYDVAQSRARDRA